VMNGSWNITQTNEKGICTLARSYVEY